MIDNTFQILSNGQVKRISEDQYLKTIYNPKRENWIVGYISGGAVLFHHKGQSIYFRSKQLSAILELLVADKNTGEKTHV